jgi:hypothetical protein
MNVVLKKHLYVNMGVRPKENGLKIPGVGEHFIV